jgi:hypothetical protein
MNWRLPAIDRRGRCSAAQCKWRMGVSVLRGCAILLFSAASNASGHPADSPPDQKADTASIVQRLVENNKDRADRLRTAHQSAITTSSSMVLVATWKRIWMSTCWITVQHQERFT